MKKSALVLGGGGFIGNHLVNSLKKENFYVRAVDLKKPEFNESLADDFFIGDLTDNAFVSLVMHGPDQKSLDDKKNSFDEVYQLAADMGGAGYIFTGENDAKLMHNSAMVNLNVAEQAMKFNVKKLFFSSSACIYPEYNQLDPDNPKCAETDAYPANPDSEYGWEKLFSERMYLAFRKNYGLDVSIGRYHNIYGPLSTFEGGKEKSPAALCRKVCQAKNDEYIEIWGDGKQTRSFLYIDDCIDATKKLIRNKEFYGPVNIGSTEMISINNFANMIIEISGKNLQLKNIEGPLGVRGRNSDNTLINQYLNWQPKYSLFDGIKNTYAWIKKSIDEKNS